MSRTNVLRRMQVLEVKPKCDTDVLSAIFCHPHLFSEPGFQANLVQGIDESFHAYNLV
jgi:hypothetical protein